MDVATTYKLTAAIQPISVQVETDNKDDGLHIYQTSTDKVTFVNDDESSSFDASSINDEIDDSVSDISSTDCILLERGQDGNDSSRIISCNTAADK